MSSILRALKKLDEGSATPRESESQPRPAVSPVVINKFLLALSSLLLLAIAGWIIIHPTGKPGMEIKPDTALQKSTMTDNPPQVPTSNGTLPGKLLPEVSGAGPSKPSPVKEEEPLRPVAGTAPARETSGALDEEESRGDDGAAVKNENKAGLSLTGILWSQSPGRRLALINDIYLKEGDRIKGISVIRIEQNEVTLKSGAKTWTIGIKK